MLKNVFNSLVLALVAMSCDSSSTGTSQTITCTDINGISYDIVELGMQVWMAENLQTTHFQNGDPIPTGFDSTEWIDLTSSGYSVYNNDPANADTYGFLYNWHAVEDDRGICPEGWHVPTDDEWKELERFLGMSEEEAHSDGLRGTNQGSQLAGNGNSWNNSSLKNDPAFGSSGFTALPGGFRSGDNGLYGTMNTEGFFWTSTPSNGTTGTWYRLLNDYYTAVIRSGHSGNFGFSVRCVTY